MLEKVKSELSRFDMYGAADARALCELYINRDILMTQSAFLSSALYYIDDGGKSRGAYLITDMSAPDVLSSKLSPETDTAHAGSVLTVSYSGGDFECAFEHVRPIPTGEDWFENVYRDFRTGEIYKK